MSSLALFAARRPQSAGRSWSAVLRAVAPLALILLLAAALRLPEIRSPLDDAFSWREASTAMMADNFYQRNWNVLFPAVSWTGPGPGYQGREFQVVSYIAALLDAGFGWHDWFGRAVAAAFGLWSVLALHRLLARLSGPTQAAAGALTLALLPGTVMIDTSFLPGPAMLAFVLTGLWALVAWLQTERAWLLALAAGCLALGVLAKPFGAVALIPAGYAAFDMLRRRGALDRPRLLRLAAALLAIAAPVIAYFSWAVHLGATTPPYHVAGAGFTWDQLGETLRHGFYLKTTARHVLLWFVGVPVFLLCGLGLAASPPAGSRDAPWLFHVWLGAAAVVYLLAAREISQNPWNLLIFAPPAAALAGRGLVAAVRSPAGSLHTWPARVRLAGLAAMLAWSCATGVHVMKAPYAGSAHDLGVKLAALSAPGELVVTAVTSIGDPVAIYYSRRRGWVFPPYASGRDAGRLEDDPQAIAALQRLRREGADWFGMTRDATDDEQRRMLEHNPGLIAYLDRTARREVDDGEVLVWRLSAPVRPAA